MNTKLVYSVVGNKNNNYVEEACVSAWSAKYYNRNVITIFVCDKETYVYIQEYKKRADIFTAIDEVICIEVPEDLDSKAKSRWIKTSARKYVDGNILCIDTDTVVCSDLSDLDNLNIQIGAVQDYHCNYLTAFYRQRIENKVFDIYNYKLDSNTTRYFNSGVIYSKDCKEAHDLYEKWHIYWQEGLEKGIDRDQFALVRACADIGINEIDDNYNCMVRASIQYLYTAKILHFFNSGWGGDSISPFFSGEIYKDIKKDGVISQKNVERILNCKSMFSSPSIVFDMEESQLVLSPAFKLLTFWFRSKKKTFNLFNLLSRGILKLSGL